jgi:hypothetical protein
MKRKADMLGKACATFSELWWQSFLMPLESSWHELSCTASYGGDEALIWLMLVNIPCNDQSVGYM